MANNNLKRVQIQVRDIETNRLRVMGTDGIVYCDGRHSQRRAAQTIRVIANYYASKDKGLYFDGWVYRLNDRDYYNIFTNSYVTELV